MAAVVDVVMAPAADAQQQKRSFAADITNQGESQPKKPKQDPKKKVLFEWSDADMANSKARVDATKAARACRRPYATIAALQLRHAPKSLSPNAAFYEHASPSAVDAVKARRSGVTLGAKQPLKKRPLFGGMAHVSNAPAAPANIVGVNEKIAVASKKGIERQARQKQTQKGWATAGVTRAPEFRMWRIDQEGPEDSPWYTDTQKAEVDCKRRWPNVAKTHPDYETTKMTNKLLRALTGRSPRSICGSRAEARTLEKTVAATKWKLAWKEK